MNTTNEKEKSEDMIIWLCMWSQTTNNNNNNDKTNNSYMIRLSQMVELFLGQTHKKYIYIYEDDDDDDDGTQYS